jgi:hypothetical protein
MAASTRPEQVYIKKTNTENAVPVRTARQHCRTRRGGPSGDERLLPLGSAKLSAKIRRMVIPGDLRNPAILPLRFIPQIVRMVPVTFYTTLAVSDRM